jgi:type II restriction/modification system DNA methylase subunit YeeA
VEKSLLQRNPAQMTWHNIPKEIPKLFAGATMNNFDIEFKNNKMM